MGFRHIFFLDNGSTDWTISIAQQHPNVSISSCHLPIEANQPLFKKYLAKTSAEGGWCLDADIDEFFDYPFSDRMSLRNFLEYLNLEGSTAVVTQLLDMFSDKPLSELATTPEHDLKDLYQYYDLSNMNQIGYSDAGIVATFGPDNYITDRKTALYFGGIRKTLYGNDCLLTKHSLFVPGKADPFPHVHFVNHAKLADVSCVMLHYKLTGNALETAAQNKEGFVGNSQGYRDFINFLQSHSNGSIKTDTAYRLRNVSDLVENGFLFTSNEYEQYVRDRERRVQAQSELQTSLS